MHGGRVYVQSDGEGKGSIFTMEIPLSQSALVAPFPRPTSVATGPLANIYIPRVPSFIDSILSKVNSRSGSERIARLGYSYSEKSRISSERQSFTALETCYLTVLLVDDAALNRKMLRRLLEPRFQNILEAENGMEALHMVERLMLEPSGQSPDIILMDSVMPMMSGPIAAKKIRALGFKGLIIGVTGNALPADIDTFISHGADHVIAKPLRIEELCLVVSSGMRNNSVRVMR